VLCPCKQLHASSHAVSSSSSSTTTTTTTTTAATKISSTVCKCFCNHHASMLPIAAGTPCLFWASLRCRSSTPPSQTTSATSGCSQGRAAVLSAQLQLPRSCSQGIQQKPRPSATSWHGGVHTKACATASAYRQLKNGVRESRQTRGLVDVIGSTGERTAEETYQHWASIGIPEPNFQTRCTITARFCLPLS